MGIIHDMDRSVNNFVKFYHDFTGNLINEEEADKKPVPKERPAFRFLKRKTQGGSDFEQKKKKQDRFFPGNPASVFGKCVRDCDRAGERAESAVCNGGMPDGWRYRPCAVRKTRDRSYGNGEHNENHDMHSGTGKRTRADGRNCIG